AESFEAPHQGFWRLLEDAGERPDVFGADRQDLAVEATTPHLSHADVALQDRGLWAVGLGEAYEVDADLPGRGDGAVAVAAGLVVGIAGEQLVDRDTGE